MSYFESEDHGTISHLKSVLREAEEAVTNVVIEDEYVSNLPFKQISLIVECIGKEFSSI